MPTDTLPSQLGTQYDPDAQANDPILMEAKEGTPYNGWNNLGDELIIDGENLSKPSTLSPSASKKNLGFVQALERDNYGNAGLEDNWLRLQMQHGETFSEKEWIFKQKYPEGSLEQDPATGKLLFKKRLEDEWNVVDPGTKARVIQQTQPDGSVINVSLVDPTDIPEDILEFFGGSELSLAGETVGGALPGSTLAKGVRMIIGAGVGKYVQEKLEDEFYGWGSPDSWTEDMYKSLEEMGAVALGLGMYKIGSVTVNLSTGNGLFNLKEGAREAILAAKRLGLERPTAGATVQKQLFAKMEAQAESVTGKLTDHVLHMRKKLEKKLADYSDVEASKYLIDGRLQEAMDDHFALWVGMARAKTFTTEEGGKLLREGYNTFKEWSQGRVKEAYAAATRYGNPQFDLEGLNTSIKKILTDNRVTTVDGKTKDIVPVNKDMSDFINTLENLDPKSLTVQQVIDLRSRAYDLSLKPSLGGNNPGYKIANKVYAELSGMLRSAKVMGGSENAKLWEMANKLAEQRFKKLDIMKAVNLSKSGKGTDSEIAATFFNKMDAASVRVVHDSLSPEQWTKVKRSFLGTIFDDPFTAASKLKTMDQKVLGMMLNKKDIKHAKTIAGVIEDIHVKPGLRELLDSHTEVKEFTHGLLKTKSANLDRLDQILLKDPKAKRAVRSALFEHVLETAKVYNKHSFGKDMQTLPFRKAVDEILNGKFARYLSPEDKRFLNDTSSLVHFYNATSDIQASLYGGEITSGMAKFKAGAWIKFLHATGMGTLFTSHAFKVVAQGWGRNVGRDPMSAPSLAVTAGIASSLFADEYRQVDKKDEQLEKLKSSTAYTH